MPSSHMTAGVRICAPTASSGRSCTCCISGGKVNVNLELRFGEFKIVHDFLSLLGVSYGLFDVWVDYVHQGFVRHGNHDLASLYIVASSERFSRLLPSNIGLNNRKFESRPKGVPVVRLKALGRGSRPGDRICRPRLFTNNYGTLGSCR
jgi:hypothetical protein